MTTARSRRAFLREGSLFLTALSLAEAEGALAQSTPATVAALVTDVHFAEADARGSRHYRESIAKMREAATTLGRRKPDIAIELGDFIDSAPKAGAKEEKAFLKRINEEFATLCPRRHYVLGNHCVGKLSKKQFLETVEQKSSYYSFDRNGFHFIVLDACYRRDGVSYDAGNFEWTDTEIPPEQREWLKADLKAAKGKALVFCHQRIDLEPGNEEGIHSSATVREILRDSGKVLAAFMGHSHRNEYRQIDGVHYVALAAMVEGSGAENSGYSLLHAFPNGDLRLDGFRHHAENPFARRSTR
ncbi:MAG: metallophosphoesterase [Capsulimonadales bacterium]|nr:metallophosphoesterase [Capsulimonadales bacterium]